MKWFLIYSFFAGAYTIATIRHYGLAKACPNWQTKTLMYLSFLILEGSVWVLGFATDIMQFFMREQSK